VLQPAGVTTDPGVAALLLITVTVVDEAQLQVLVVLKSVGVQEETGRKLK